MRSLSRLLVSLRDFETNLELVRQMAPGKKILPMLKAQAYGHGMIPMARHLFSVMDHRHLEGIGVASLDEAMNLRSELPQCPVPIYVFSELSINNVKKNDWYAQWGIFPVLSHIDDLKFFLNHKDFKKIPLILKFNSGMNRLGLSPAQQGEIIDLLKAAGRTSIYHLMSHFAASFIKNHPSITQQQKIMDEIKKNFAHQNIAVEHFSMANSGALEQNLSLSDSVVRPGLILYGPKSLNVESLWKGRVISSLETTVLEVKALRAKDKFGYGLMEAKQDGYLIILPLGYADGMQFTFGGFKFKVDEINLEVVGRVNMDLMYLWATDAKVLQWRGKQIKFWGPENQNLQLLSDHAQTITYQILTSISSRVPRDYPLQ